MSTGLAASTVTPGRTAPEVSRTLPARLCAEANDEARMVRNADRKRCLLIVFMAHLLFGNDGAARRPSASRSRAAGAAGAAPAVDSNRPVGLSLGVDIRLPGRQQRLQPPGQSLPLARHVVPLADVLAHVKDQRVVTIDH